MDEKRPIHIGVLFPEPDIPFGRIWTLASESVIVEPVRQLDTTFLWRKAIIAGVVTMLSIGSLAASAEAKQGQVEFAELVHDRSAEQGDRTKLKLFTTGVHASDGGEVIATFRDEAAESVQRRSRASRFGVWVVNRETTAGRQLVSAVRQNLIRRGKARCGAVVFNTPGGGGAGFSFKLRGTNERTRAERLIIS